MRPRARTANSTRQSQSVARARAYGSGAQGMLGLLQMASFVNRAVRDLEENRYRGRFHCISRCMDHIVAHHARGACTFFFIQG